MSGSFNLTNFFILSYTDSLQTKGFVGHRYVMTTDVNTVYTHTISRGKRMCEQ